VLQRAGYFAAGIGKFHNYPQEPGLHMRGREDFKHALGLVYVNETAGPHATAYMASYMTGEWDKRGYGKYTNRTTSLEQHMREALLKRLIFSQYSM